MNSVDGIEDDFPGLNENETKIVRGNLRAYTAALEAEEFGRAVDAIQTCLRFVPSKLEFHAFFIGAARKAVPPKKGVTAVAGNALRQFKQGRTTMDDEAYREAIALDPHNTELLCSFGEYCGEHHNRDIEIHYYRTALTIESANNDIRRRLAFVLEDIEEYEGAKTLWEAIYKSDDTDGVARKKITDMHALIAQRFMEAKNSEPEEPIDPYEEHARDFRSSREAVSDEAREDPETRLTHAIRTNPNSAEPHLQYADFLKAQRRYNDCWEQWERAKQKEPQRAAVIQTLQFQLIVERSSTRLAKARELGLPEVPELESKLLTAKIRLARHELNNGSQNTTKKFELATLLYQQGESNTEVISLLQGDTTQDQRLAGRREHLLALCFLREGQTRMAITNFRSAIEILTPVQQDKQETLLDSLYQLAYLLKEKEETRAEALELFERILSIDYNYKDVAALCEKLEE